MAEDPLPDQTGLLIAAAFLAFGGWTGLILLFSMALPNLGARWLFFVLWVIALTGTAVPFVRYLNRRFAKGQVPPAVMLREALFVGLFGAVLAWLQVSRVLTAPVALLIAAGLAALDGLLRLRDRSRWIPEE